MKHLSHFINYILENKEIDFQEIEDMLIPISDLGVKYKIYRSKEPLMNNDKYEGSYYTRINFTLSNIEVISSSNMYDGHNDYLGGNVVFDFLDELVILRNRMESSNIFLSLSSSNDDIYVSFVVVDDSGDISTDEYKIKRLYKDLVKNRKNKQGDFYRYMRFSVLDDGIQLYDIRGYTDTKFNNFVKGVDLNNFDVSKDISKYNTKIEFKLKK